MEKTSGKNFIDIYNQIFCWYDSEDKLLIFIMLSLFLTVTYVPDESLYSEICETSLSGNNNKGNFKLELLCEVCKYTHL